VLDQVKPGEHGRDVPRTVVVEEGVPDRGKVESPLALDAEHLSLAGRIVPIFHLAVQELTLKVGTDRLDLLFIQHGILLSSQRLRRPLLPGMWETQVPIYWSSSPHDPGPDPFTGSL
jgi:hypothetical protein